MMNSPLLICARNWRHNKPKAWRSGNDIREIVKKANPGSDANDTNYIFLRFVGDFLPNGIVGLIIAIIFLASWGAIAAALNSLASTTMVDFHMKLTKKRLRRCRNIAGRKRIRLSGASSVCLRHNLRTTLATA